MAEYKEMLEATKKITDKITEKMDPYLNTSYEKTKDFLKDSVKVGAKFESQMSSLKAVTKSSSSEMERLYSLAVKMGTTTGFSAENAGEEMERLALA